MRSFLWATCALIVAACSSTPRNSASTNSAPAAYPGYKGQYDGFRLVLDERFDALDAAVWSAGDGAVGEEAACRFQKEGLQINNGVLQLMVREQYVPSSWSVDHNQMKKDYNYLCGELRTNPDYKIRYGRIETRMRAPSREAASGYISSLFTYNVAVEDGKDVLTGSEWEEIDVELEGGRPDKFQANLIYGRNTWEWWRTRGYGAWEEKIDIPPADEWRVFAIEWVPDAIRWYVDGVLVKTLKASDLDCKPNCVGPQIHPTPIPDNPTTITMNFWIPNDVIQNEFGGNKERNQYPMVAEYDWLRYYQREPEPNGDNH